MKYILFVLFLISPLLIYSCRESTKNNNPDTKQTINSSNTQNQEYNIRSQIFRTRTGWGYDIYINGKKYIHQPAIPGISGIRSFSTREKAKKTAEFVCSKIRENIIPPSVSSEELDSLGVLN